MLLKTRDLRDKSIEELQDELETLTEELFKAKMKLAARQTENLAEPYNLRKSIARIKTLIAEKQLVGSDDLEDS